MNLDTALDLEVLAGELAVCQLPAGSDVPQWAVGEGLWMILGAPDEISVVCPVDRVPAGTRHVAGWRAFRVVGPLDFSLVGVLHSLTKPLAEAGVSLFALSSFNTDYILVRGSEFPDAREALTAAGHRLHS